MKRMRSVARPGKVSPAMKAVARQLAAEAGIEPLPPDQQRPDDFYVVSHFTGKPLIKDRNALVPGRRTAESD